MGHGIRFLQSLWSPKVTEPRVSLDVLMSGSSNIYAVLYNDEVHSFDDVITQLSRAMQSCTVDAGRVYANAGLPPHLCDPGLIRTVDREGRAIITRATEAECHRVKGVMQEVALRTKVFNSIVISTQDAALSILAWITKVVLLMCLN